MLGNTNYFVICVTALLLKSGLRENSNNLTTSCTAIAFLCLQLSAHQPMWILQHYIMSHPFVSGVTLFSKKRKDYAFNEKPSITPACSGMQTYWGCFSPLCCSSYCLLLAVHICNCSLGISSPWWCCVGHAFGYRSVEACSAFVLKWHSWWIYMPDAYVITCFQQT